MQIEYFIYYIYYAFWELPLVLRISFFVLTLFLPMYFLNMYIFLKYRSKYNYERKHNKQIEDKYGDKFQSILTSSKTLSQADFDDIFDPKVKKLNKKNKKILAKVLSSIYKDASFINYQNNINLLEYLNIHRFLEKQLSNGNGIEKQNSLRSLDDLHSRASGAILIGLTYNRKKYLRKRARSSYLRSTPNDPFRFFDENFDKDLNRWDKIDIHYALEKRAENGELPNLVQWVLRCDSLDFRCFMVDEISFFNQKENAQTLLQIIENKETEAILRKHCIEAIGKMNYRDAEPHMLNMYDMQPQNVQDSIIIAIGKFESGKALEFLVRTYESATDDSKKLSILSTIYHYGKEGREWFENAKKEHNNRDFSSLMFEHVSNPLLSI